MVKIAACAAVIHAVSLTAPAIAAPNPGNIQVEVLRIYPANSAYGDNPNWGQKPKYDKNHGVNRNPQLCTII